FAGPFCAVLLLDTIPAAAARRLMLAWIAASVFHTAPWIAMNTSVTRTMERVARMPLPAGRGETMIGTYYLNSGDPVAAESWFRRAIARDSANVNSQSGLGLALARQQRLTDAVRPMTAAVLLRPGMPAYEDDLIALDFALGRWSDAALVLRNRVARNPGDGHAWVGLAECATRQGQADSTVIVLETARTRAGTA